MKSFVLTAMLMGFGMASASPLPNLRVQGTDLVDPQGNRVLLNGVNLGNWLMLEMWMLYLTEPNRAVRDQAEFFRILRTRFGEERKDQLMDVYRGSWITERDFAMIRSFGKNVVRLPICYRLLEDPNRPKTLQPDAFKWIDRAVDMAEAHGIYVILGLHGAPGGQSVFDHTGEAGQNRLWTTPEAQDRTIWLWQQMATRYRDRSAVAAYTVLNEPYGATPDQLVSLMDRLVKAIREIDPDTLLYVPALTTGFDFYGSFADRGWRNVGLTEHFYPGLFGGGPPTVMTHTRHLRWLDSHSQRVAALNVPYLVGEMNVVYRAAGGASMMRRTFDKHRSFGWSTTMWCYKVLNRDGGHGHATWGMVTNRGPVNRIDIRTASDAEIEAWFRSFATMDYAVYEELKHFLTHPNPELDPIPELPEPIRSVPHQGELPGWTVSDIAGSLRGGLRVHSGGRFDLYGGGEDIWNTQDQFRFLYRQMRGNFDIDVRSDSLSDVGAHAKAGLMIRASLDAGSPHVLLSLFPSAEAQLAIRRTQNGPTEDVGSGDGDWPVRLRMQRRGSTVTAWMTQRDGTWHQVGSVELPALGAEVFVGVVSLSHDNMQLARASYRDLRLVRR